MRDSYFLPGVRASADLMHLAELEGWLITRIEVGQESRGQGHARKLLEQACADADAEGQRLFLEVSPDGTGLDEDQLRQWYGRYGFGPVEPGMETSLKRESR